MLISYSGHIRVGDDWGLGMRWNEDFIGHNESHGDLTIRKMSCFASGASMHKHEAHVCTYILHDTWHSTSYIIYNICICTRVAIFLLFWFYFFVGPKSKIHIDPHRSYVFHFRIHQSPVVRLVRPRRCFWWRHVRSSVFRRVGALFTRQQMTQRSAKNGFRLA